MYNNSIGLDESILSVMRLTRVKQLIWSFSILVFMHGVALCARLDKVVEVSPAKRQAIVKSIKLIGLIKAHKASHLFAEVDGQIDQIYVADGARVGKGTLLLTLQDDDLKRQQDLAIAAAKLAESNYQRIKKLYGDKGVSLQKKDDAKAAWLQARLALHAIQHRLTKTQVTAPFDGVLGTFKVSDGAMLKHGESIVMIHDTSSYKVEFSVPATLLSKIKVGQLIQVAQNTGRVESLQTTLDPKTHMGLARARLSTCQDCLLGRTVEVYLVVDRLPEALAVPKTAIFNKRNESYVYIVKEGKAYMQKVSLGLKGDNLTEIVAGLKVGDIVVIANQSRLYHSIPVRVNP